MKWDILMRKISSNKESKLNARRFRDGYRMGLRVAYLYVLNMERFNHDFKQLKKDLRSTHDEWARDEKANLMFQVPGMKQARNRHYQSIYRKKHAKANQKATTSRRSKRS